MVHQSFSMWPCHYTFPNKEFLISHAEQLLAIQHADEIKTVSKKQICFQLEWSYLCGHMKTNNCAIRVCSKITHSSSNIFIAYTKLVVPHQKCS
jgi:hypothetical protein